MNLDDRHHGVFWLVSVIAERVDKLGDLAGAVAFAPKQTLASIDRAKADID